MLFRSVSQSRYSEGLYQVPTEPDTIPMEAAPIDEMTPEKAALLDKGRSPASAPNSDMVAVPLEDFMPAGSYMAGKGIPGQEASPDISGNPEAPVAPDRLAKLKALFQSK